VVQKVLKDNITSLTNARVFGYRFSESVKLQLFALLPLPAYIRASAQYVHQFLYPIPTPLRRELIEMYNTYNNDDNIVIGGNNYTITSSYESERNTYLTVSLPDPSQGWSRALRPHILLGTSFRCFMYAWLNVSHCQLHAQLAVRSMMKSLKRLQTPSRILPPINNNNNDGLIRVAILTSDIHAHPMYALLHALITLSRNSIIRQQFHFSLYHCKSDSAYLEPLLPFLDAKVPFDDEIDDFTLASMMRRANVDVLLDGAGATVGGRPAVALYHRPCKLQMHWGG
jgi:hypothetical protein